jgi:hypothetical protein
MIPAPRPAEPAGWGVIFRNAQARIDHLWATDLPFDLKIDAHLDVLLDVAAELERTDRRRRLSVLSRRVKHG